MIWCGQADVTLAVLQSESFMMTAWLRVWLHDGLTREDDTCMLPTAASQRKGWDVRARIWIDATVDPAFVKSLLVFVSVAGLSPAVFPVHLHGSDNNTCTGLT